MNATHNSNRPTLRTTARGLSIVELMVALAIGVILALGIMLLMSRTSNSYKVNDDYAVLQENGTSALRYIGDDIHMAGFYGLASSVQSLQTFNITNFAAGFIDYGEDAGINFGTTAAQDCGLANWSLQPSIPVAGLPPNTTGASLVDPIPPALPAVGPVALTCIPPANYSPGPALILRGAIGTMVNGVATTIGGITLQQPANVVAQLNPNTIYIQADPFIGFIFQGSQFPAYKAATYSRSIPVAGGFVDAPIYQYQTRIYYIRPCSRPTGAPFHGNPTCQAGDDGGNPIPTLVRQEWQSTPGGPAYLETGLVEGVEQMSIVYGYDTLSAAGNPIPANCLYPGQCADAPDGVADVFTTVPPTGATSPEVVAIRVDLLVRSTAGTLGYSDAAKTYNLTGAAPWNCVTAGASCKFKRHVFSQLIQVKNAGARRTG